MEKLIYGVGLNDADYKVTRKVSDKTLYCPFYERWRGMLSRCYGKRYKTYIGCTVCDSWLVFSNFKKWMLTQDWKDKELDKDLLVSGNKQYSPETCVFVSQKVNKFVIENKKSRGEFLIGTYFKKDRSKFVSLCRNPCSGKAEYLGSYDNEIEAHLAWVNRKLELVKELRAVNEIDDRIECALLSKYEGMRQSALKNESP